MAVYVGIEIGIILSFKVALGGGVLKQQFSDITESFACTNSFTKNGS